MSDAEPLAFAVTFHSADESEIFPGPSRIWALSVEHAVASARALASLLDGAERVRLRGVNSPAELELAPPWVTTEARDAPPPCPSPIGASFAATARPFLTFKAPQ